MNALHFSDRRMRTNATELLQYLQSSFSKRNLEPTSVTTNRLRVRCRRRDPTPSVRKRIATLVFVCGTFCLQQCCLAEAGGNVAPQITRVAAHRSCLTAMWRLIYIRDGGLPLRST